MIDFKRLLGKETFERFRKTGLHKIAAARLQQEGHDVGDELDLRSAIQVMATNVYVKNAEYKSIAEGLIALDALARS